MNFEQARFNMVEQQIKPWKVNDVLILDTFLNIKRELFVLEQYKELALSDLKIPLPGGQTMLTPSIEARIIQALKLTKEDLVLEIGTGSGYLTSILAKLTKFVFTIEINEINKNFAYNNLCNNNIKNIELIYSDGRNGINNKGLFDKICVGGSLINISLQLLNKLKIGGKLVGFIGVHPVMHAIEIIRMDEDNYTSNTLFETDIDYLIGENEKKFKF